MLYLNYSQLRQKGKEIFTNVNAIKTSIANNLLMHGWSQQKSLSSRTMIIKRGKFWDIIKLKHGRSVGEDLIMYLNNWSKKTSQFRETSLVLPLWRSRCYTLMNFLKFVTSLLSLSPTVCPHGYLFFRTRLPRKRMAHKQTLFLQTDLHIQTHTHREERQHTLRSRFHGSRWRLKLLYPGQRQSPPSCTCTGG